MIEEGREGAAASDQTTAHDRARLYAAYFSLRAIPNPSPSMVAAANELRQQFDDDPGSQPTRTPPVSRGHLRRVQ